MQYTYTWTTDRYVCILGRGSSVRQWTPSNLDRTSVTETYLIVPPSRRAKVKKCPRLVGQTYSVYHQSRRLPDFRLCHLFLAHNDRLRSGHIMMRIAWYTSWYIEPRVQKDLL